MSIGKISRIINEAAEKAQEFDEQVSLDNIRQVANDEIFRGSAPVLTGIDLESSFVYLRWRNRAAKRYSKSVPGG